jgi:regulator of replication initiation timing
MRMTLFILTIVSATAAYSQQKTDSPDVASQKLTEAVQTQLGRLMVDNMRLSLEINDLREKINRSDASEKRVLK